MANFDAAAQSLERIARESGVLPTEFPPSHSDDVSEASDVINQSTERSVAEIPSQPVEEEPVISKEIVIDGSVVSASSELPSPAYATDLFGSEITPTSFESESTPSTTTSVVRPPSSRKNVSGPACLMLPVPLDKPRRTVPPPVVQQTHTMPEAASTVTEFLSPAEVLFNVRFPASAPLLRQRLAFTKQPSGKTTVETVTTKSMSDNRTKNASTEDLGVFQMEWYEDVSRLREFIISNIGTMQVISVWTFSFFLRHWLPDGIKFRLEWVAFAILCVVHLFHMLINSARSFLAACVFLVILNGGFYTYFTDFTFNHDIPVVYANLFVYGVLVSIMKKCHDSLVIFVWLSLLIMDYVLKPIIPNSHFELLLAIHCTSYGLYLIMHEVTYFGSELKTDRISQLAMIDGNGGDLIPETSSSFAYYMDLFLGGHFTDSATGYSVLRPKTFVKGAFYFYSNWFMRNARFELTALVALTAEDLELRVNGQRWYRASISMRDGQILIYGLEPGQIYEVELGIRGYWSTVVSVQTYTLERETKRDCERQLNGAKVLDKNKVKHKMIVESFGDGSDNGDAATSIDAGDELASQTHASRGVRGQETDDRSAVVSSAVNADESSRETSGDSPADAMARDRSNGTGVIEDDDQTKVDSPSVTIPPANALTTTEMTETPLTPTTATTGEPETTSTNDDDEFSHMSSQQLLASLEEEAVKKRNTQASIKKFRRDKSKMVVSLQNEIHILTDTIDRETGIETRGKSRIVALEDQIRQLQAQYDEIQNTLVSTGPTANDLRLQAESLLKQSRGLGDRVRQLEQQIATSLASHNTRINELDTRHKALIATRTSLQSERSQLEQLHTTIVTSDRHQMYPELKREAIAKRDETRAASMAHERHMLQILHEKQMSIFELQDACAEIRKEIRTVSKTRDQERLFKDRLYEELVKIVGSAS
eukprot:jgi/Hompol1/1823/HPOL_002774-RA